MLESKFAQGAMATTAKTLPESNWRRRMLAIGFVLLFLAVGLGAAGKGGLGNAPMVLAGVAIVLFVIAAFGSVVRYVSARGKPA